jgi:hypothetical protein
MEAAITNVLADHLAQVNTTIMELKAEINSIKTDIASIKTDIANIKKDVTDIKEDITDLKTDVRCVARMSSGHFFIVFNIVSCIQVVFRLTIRVQLMAQCGILLRSHLQMENGQHIWR